MDSVRRTVPRSARRIPRAPTDGNNAVPAAPTPESQGRGLSQPRYIPGFSPSVRPSTGRNEHSQLSNTKQTPQQQQKLYQQQQQQLQQPKPLPITSHQNTLSSIAYGSSPQTCVRWLPSLPGARQALALAGSYESLSLFAVWTDNSTPDGSTSLNHSLVNEFDFEDGIITCLGIPYDTTTSLKVGIGSSSGSIQLLTLRLDDEDVNNMDLVNIGQLKMTTPSSAYPMFNESVVGVASLSSSNKIVAGGENGTVSLYEIETCEMQWGERFDQVGLQSLSCVNEIGSQIAGSSINGNISVWDIRSRTVVQKLSHTNNSTSIKHIASCTCLSTDMSQPHFILGGFNNGEICTWDRGGGFGEDVISRATVHEGTF